MVFVYVWERIRIVYEWFLIVNTVYNYPLKLVYIRVWIHCCFECPLIQRTSERIIEDHIWPGKQ